MSEELESTWYVQGLSLAQRTIHGSVNCVISLSWPNILLLWVCIEMFFETY